MNIYLHKRIKEAFHDEVRGHVIIAETEQNARALAAGFCELYDKEVWLSNKESTCVLIGTANSDSEKIILTDFFEA